MIYINERQWGEPWQEVKWTPLSMIWLIRLGDRKSPGVVPSNWPGHFARDLLVVCLGRIAASTKGDGESVFDSESSEFRRRSRRRERKTPKRKREWGWRRGTYNDEENNLICGGRSSGRPSSEKKRKGEMIQRSSPPWEDDGDRRGSRRAKNTRVSSDSERIWFIVGLSEMKKFSEAAIGVLTRNPTLNRSTGSANRFFYFRLQNPFYFF